MYLDKLLIKEFGQFNNEEIELKPGFNFVYGDNKAKRTSVMDFSVGMMYGMAKSRGLGNYHKIYERNKPKKALGYSGKAYIKKDNDTFFVEKSFLKHSQKMSMLNIGTGREVQVNSKNSLRNTLFEVSKNTYISTFCINNAFKDNMEEFLGNYATTGSPDIDKAKAVAALKEKRKEFDKTELEKRITDIGNELIDYKDVEDKIKDIRNKIKEVDEELAIETAKRKREARKLIESGNVKDEDANVDADNTSWENEEKTDELKNNSESDSQSGDKHEDANSLSDKKTDDYDVLSDNDNVIMRNKDAEVSVEEIEEENNENSETSEASSESEDDSKKSKKEDKESNLFLNADLIKDVKEVKKLSERLWFIILTGFFVVGVITAFVYILPFDKGVRQIFVICTILFVLVTIVEGLFAKGIFEGDVGTPDDDDFKRVIYELERKTETYEDVKIDMTFAQAYKDRKSDLRVVEKQLLDDKVRKEQLEEELAQITEKRDNVDKEVHAINLAINTINELSTEFHDELGFIINNNISEIVTKMTNGRYIDVFMDDSHNMKAKSNTGIVFVDRLDDNSKEQIYISMRLCVAKVLGTHRLPFIINEMFDDMNDITFSNMMECLNMISTDQYIIITSNPDIKRMIEGLEYECNYVEL